MPQPALAGPFSESHLRDQPRLDPVHAALGQRISFEWRVALLQARELVAKPFQHLIAESSSHLARVLELAPLVVTEEERTQSHARALGIAIAADDEFLLLA